MRRAAVAIGTAVLALVPAEAAPARSRSQPPVTVAADAVISPDGRLHELHLNTDTVGPTVVRVLLPAGYDDPGHAGRRYPVLYLLHGVGDNATTWTEKSDVEQLTAAEDVVVVMPDGGAPRGFYSDWLAGPAWETYHIEQLIPLIDQAYRTVPARAGRAVAGMSMGGYGAMLYAARHPDLFAAAASFSGVVDVADGSVLEASVLELLGYGSDQRWGPFLTHEVVWRDHNPPDLATNLRWTDVSLYTGNGVPRPGDNPASGPVEAAVHLLNVLMHTRLGLQGIDHRWVDYGSGTHEWHYWQAALHQWLPTALDVFAQPRSAPEAFDYRTAEAEFSVWDWSFAASRPASEFVDLTAVSSTGLTVRGSGRLTVTTAPAYAPGEEYRVAAVNQAGPLSLGDVIAPLRDLDVTLAAVGDPSGPGSTAAAVRADADGRLRFVVDLGPGHHAQQYTLAATAAEALDPLAYWGVRTVTITPVAAAPMATAPAASGSAAPTAIVDAVASSRHTAGAALPATGGRTPLTGAVLLVAGVVLGRLVLRLGHSGSLAGTDAAS